jgi:peptidoglycan hydrolase-like protein with peptidoglycan-binding domain
MRKNLFIKACMLLFTAGIINSTFAQDANEIQVYGSATTPKYTTLVELHNNYTFKGPKFNPDYHPFLQTLEVTTGISENFEFGFYIFTYNNNGKTQYTGSNIRPRVKAPDEWNLPIGLSLSSEIGCSIDPTTQNNDWGAEIRPILDKTMGAHYFSFNPNIGVSFTNKEYLFEPNFKYAYSTSPKANLGFEYYGNTGKIFNPYKLPEQEHQLYLVVDLFLHPLYEFNFGIGKGLTDASNGTTVKCYIGRRINWKHPKK